MAGTATIRTYFDLANLGSLAPLSNEITIENIDEFNHEYVDSLAASGTLQLGVGQVTTVTGVIIHLITGGTTVATGLGIDLEASSWLKTFSVVLKGQSAIFLTSISTLSCKNLDSSAATFEYIVFGEA